MVCRYVVDSCFVKQRAYNPLLGLEALCVAPISKVRKCKPWPLLACVFFSWKAYVAVLSEPPQCLMTDAFSMCLGPMLD